MSRRVLVTGGAGFIGSHCVALLVARGHQVTVLDNLRQGHRAAVPPGIELIEADISEADAVLAEAPFDAVLHFAALSLVAESMRDPMRYFLQNSAGGMALIEACLKRGIRRFVLSSTAALFGHADQIPITETAAIDPGSPYGESKHMLERALFWADRVHGMRSACLRYFNAAGADPEGRLGEDHEPETHLIPLAIDAALGRRPPLTLFGTDYPTPDGTAIRDYIHVTDLAEAHLLALDRIEQASATYNLGTGTGHSVREVVAAVGRVLGRPVPVVMGARRPGDPAVLVASAERFRRDTGWSPRFADLDEIVRTAARWREAHPHGYDDRPKGSAA